jgi:hypothetical protein
MKKVVFLFLLFCINTVFAQQKKDSIINPYFSAEAFFVYPHYFSGYKNQFTYGFGAAISGKFKRFKFTTGLFYTTKKYIERFDEVYPVDIITYRVDYFNVPILIGFPLTKQEEKKNHFLLTTGIIINIPRSYKEVIYYKKINSETIYTSGYGAGSSFRLAFQINRWIARQFKLYVQIFGDYKFLIDDVQYDLYETNRLLMGLNVGIEWTHQKRLKIFYVE